jgi:peptidoglycan/LPS O-acetylase OafA/YrhL
MSLKIFGFSEIAGSLHSNKYRPDIDGLRAVAVSSVVICHAFPGVLPGGFVGVDIFFVISGYLISSILIGDLEKNRFSLLRFYDRRIRRIFPALIAVLVATTAVGWFVLFRPEFQMLGKHVAASTLFSENFQLWAESGYFDVSSQKKPLLHLWSLAIEEQFYIFWPMLMYLARRGRVNFIAMFAVLGALSFAINLYDIHHDPTAAYYSPVGRFWELMIGSCLAYLRVDRPQILDRFKNAQSALGAIFIVVSLVLMNPERDFPGFWALLPTVGTFLLISGGEHSWINRKILSTGPFVWCGLISYPLYLWHWPLLSFAYIVFDDISTSKALVLVVLAVAASVLTFLFIERPFRRPSNGAAKPLALLAAMVVVLVCGAVIMTGALRSRLWHFDAPMRTEWDFLKNRTADFDKNGNGIYALHAERPQLALFIGDSHIAQYAERIDKVVGADPNRLGAVLAIGGGCIPIEGVTTADIRRNDCWALRDRAYKMALQGRFKTIVIGASWNWYFFESTYSYDGDGKSFAMDSAEGRTAAIARLERRISALVGAGKRVVLLLDNPASPAFSSTGWRARLVSSSANFTPNRTVPAEPAQLDLQQRLAAMGRRAGAQIVDPFDAICTNGKCLATTATGQPVFKDPTHFNPDWASGHAGFIDMTTAR